MLLSMFISFLLARRFRRRTYVALIVVIIVLVSFFSAFGLIRKHQYKELGKSTDWYTFHPVPLSFPFYASVFYSWNVYPIGVDGSRFTYQIVFMAFELTRATTYYPSPLTLRSASVYYSLFLLVNIVGTIFGYWISKSTFIDKLLKKG